MMKHVLQNFDWECATPGPVIYATPNQQMLKKFYLASSFLSRQSEARCFYRFTVVGISNETKLSVETKADSSTDSTPN